VLQYGGERNINPRPSYIRAYSEWRNGSDVEVENSDAREDVWEGRNEFTGGMNGKERVVIVY
jgi:hypothetical protein